MPRAGNVAAVFAGGCLGALTRAGVAESLPHAAAGWPWATLVVNLLGALFLGWVLASPARHRRPLLGTGFCGALTTFSALQVELVGMLDRGAWGLAAGYVAASLAGGLLAVHVGSLLVRPA
jgi:fluoride exporter